MDYVEQSTENDDRHKTVQLSNEHGLPSDEEQLKVMNLNTYEEGLDADHIEDEPPDIFVPTADNGLSNDDYDIIFKQRHLSGFIGPRCARLGSCTVSPVPTSTKTMSITIGIPITWPAIVGAIPLG